MNSRQLVSDFYKAKPLDAVAWMEARDQDLLRGESVRILEDLYFEAGWLGWCTAAFLISEARGRRKAPDVAARVDWGGWVPGDADAARKLLGDKDIPGLQDLLDKRSVTIKGIEDTRYKDLASILARGVANGDSMETVAGEIVDYLKVDADWADTVARTETRSAVTQASLDSYRDASISQKEWLTAWDEACDICSDAQAMGPVPIDEDFGEAGDGPPGHPNCLCVVLPVIGAESEEVAESPDSVPPVDVPPVVEQGPVPPWLPSDVVLGERTGAAAGSNTSGMSGFWTGTDGVERYVKEYQNPEQAFTELLSNRVYQELGANAPNTSLSSYVDDAGNTRTILVTEIVPNDGTVGKLGLTPDVAKEVTNNFAADLWLANYDAVGTGLDNIVIGKDGAVYRVDAGGTLEFRAMGGKKTGDELREVDAQAFFDKNPYYGDVLRTAGYDTVNDMAGVLPDQIREIRDFVDASGGFKSIVDNLKRDIEDAAGKPLDFKFSTGKYGMWLEQRLNSLEMRYGNLQPVDPNTTLQPLAIDVGAKRSLSLAKPDAVHDSGARVFKGMDGIAWGNSEYKSWQDAVTTNFDQSNAVARYSGNEYHQINDSMRQQLRAGDTSISDVSRHIVDALSPTRTTEDIMVERGIQTMPASKLQELLSLRVGDLLHDYAFQSTSVGETPFKGDVLFRIRVPAGSQGAYLGQLSQYLDLEAEFLLQAGTTTRVEAIHEFGPRYVVDVTVVDQRPGEVVNANYYAGRKMVLL